MGFVHGKSCEIFHDGTGIYKDMPNPLVAGRYHSLAVSKLADGGVCTAKSKDGIVMGVRHKEYPIEGVQFHPESVLTPEGIRMVTNFLDSVG